MGHMRRVTLSFNALSTDQTRARFETLADRCADRLAPYVDGARARLVVAFPGYRIAVFLEICAEVGTNIHHMLDRMGDATGVMVLDAVDADGGAAFTIDAPLGDVPDLRRRCVDPLDPLAGILSRIELVSIENVTFAERPDADATALEAVLVGLFVARRALDEYDV